MLENFFATLDLSSAQLTQRQWSILSSSL